MNMPMSCMWEMYAGVRRDVKKYSVSNQLFCTVPLKCTELLNLGDFKRTVILLHLQFTVTNSFHLKRACLVTLAWAGISHTKKYKLTWDKNKALYIATFIDGVEKVPKFPRYIGWFQQPSCCIEMVVNATSHFSIKVNSRWVCFSTNAFKSMSKSSSFKRPRLSAVGWCTVHFLCKW